MTEKITDLIRREFERSNKQYLIPDYEEEIKYLAEMAVDRNMKKRAIRNIARGLVSEAV